MRWACKRMRNPELQDLVDAALRELTVTATLPRPSKPASADAASLPRPAIAAEDPAESEAV